MALPSSSSTIRRSTVLAMNYARRWSPGLERANADPGIKALVLIGSGARFFRRRRYP